MSNIHKIDLNSCTESWLKRALKNACWNIDLNQNKEDINKCKLFSMRKLFQYQKLVTGVSFKEISEQLYSGDIFIDINATRSFDRHYYREFQMWTCAKNTPNYIHLSD